MSHICLITTGQPSTNPRLVKEADALTAAGYTVTVVGAHWAEWAHETDEQLLATRRWRCVLADWRRSTNPSLFWKTRVRHAVGRKLATASGGRWLPGWALHRVAPEVAAMARRVPADLYIAHNLGALPAAMAAARGRVPVAFDAEDFHSGQLRTDRDGPMRVLTEHIERTLIPRCTYVTAAAPGIADAYAQLCGIGRPRVVLNVFPLADRPHARPARTDGRPQLYWFSQTVGPDRGLEDVIGAMAIRRDLPLTLHLRGVWQAGYERQLRELARAAGLKDDAIVNQPPAAPWEMVRLASRHQIGLALEPPVSDNNDMLWSNKVFTYLLAGLPVVLSRTTGQAQLASALGPAAVTYPPGDARGMAQALGPWLDSEPARQAASDHAWALGTDRYNWDVEQAAFLDEVRRVVAR
jgi:glycosyltransferase involved in cell wall biosynthesis